MLKFKLSNFFAFYRSAGRHGKPRGLKHGKLSGLRRHASCCVSLDARYFLYVIYPFLDLKDENLPVFVWKNMHKRITSPNTVPEGSF